MTRVPGRSKRRQASDADDVGGVEARGSGEGMCLRRSMYDHDARRAALDSSPDDDPHELLTSVRILVHHRTRLSTLKTNSSRRSSSSRLARAHERAGRGRAGRASKRGHRGHVRSLLVCSARRATLFCGATSIASSCLLPIFIFDRGYNLAYDIPL